MNCPLCNRPISDATYDKGYSVGGRKIRGIVECPHCLAVSGDCYLGDSYAVVSNRLQGEPSTPQGQRYFDFTTVGSAGVGRRHGWFDPATRCMTQIG